jgi:hypothetical protein
MSHAQAAPTRQSFSSSGMRPTSTRNYPPDDRSHDTSHTQNYSRDVTRDRASTSAGYRGGTENRTADRAPHRQSPRRNSSNHSFGDNGSRKENRSPKQKADHKILFQNFFKSVGPRTYAAQVKEAGNGNQFIVLTEGKRDEKTGEIRKTRLFVFSEDFEAFFEMFRKSAEFIRANPLAPAIRKRQEEYWAKRAAGENSPANGPDSSRRKIATHSGESDRPATPKR